MRVSELINVAKSQRLDSIRAKTVIGRIGKATSNRFDGWFNLELNGETISIPIEGDVIEGMGILDLQDRTIKSHEISDP